MKSLHSAVEEELKKVNGHASAVTALKLDGCSAYTVDALTSEFSGLVRLSLNSVGLTTLHNFPTLPKLCKLELKANQISGGLDALRLSNVPSLRCLKLSGNPINFLNDLIPLQSLTNLAVLDLTGCRVSHIPNYRDTIFNWFPSIQVLDGKNRHNCVANSDGEEDDEGTQDMDIGLELDIESGTSTLINMDLELTHSRLLNTSPPPRNCKLFKDNRNDPVIMSAHLFAHLTGTTFDPSDDDEPAMADVSEPQVHPPPPPVQPQSQNPQPQHPQTQSPPPVKPQPQQSQPPPPVQQPQAQPPPPQTYKAPAPQKPTPDTHVEPPSAARAQAGDKRVGANLEEPSAKRQKLSHSDPVSSPKPVQAQGERNTQPQPQGAEQPRPGAPPQRSGRLYAGLANELPEDYREDDWDDSTSEENDEMDDDPQVASVDYRSMLDPGQPAAGNHPESDEDSKDDPSFGANKS